MMITKPIKPVFNAEEDAALRNQAAKDAARILRVRGMDQTEAEQLVAKHLDQITTVARGGGQQLAIRLASGTTAGAFELRQFVAELEVEHRLDSFGPRPEAVLAERLEIGGYTPEEAAQLAKKHTRREPDGRVWIQPFGGGPEELSNPDEAAPTHGLKILNRLADRLVHELERRPAAAPVRTDPLANQVSYLI